MEAGKNPQDANQSKRDESLRREIVKDLAELLVQFDRLQALGDDLESAGMLNRLHKKMSVDEANEDLLYLVENFNLLWSDTSLDDVMKLDAHERGEWALDQVMSNISNAGQ